MDDLAIAIFLSVIFVCVSRCVDNEWQRQHEIEMNNPCKCETCESHVNTDEYDWPDPFKVEIDD